MVTSQEQLLCVLSHDVQPQTVLLKTNGCVQAKSEGHSQRHFSLLAVASRWLTSFGKGYCSLQMASVRGQVLHAWVVLSGPVKLLMHSPHRHSVAVKMAFLFSLAQVAEMSGQSEEHSCGNWHGLQLQEGRSTTLG